MEVFGKGIIGFGYYDVGSLGRLFVCDDRGWIVLYYRGQVRRFE